MKRNLMLCVSVFAMVLTLFSCESTEAIATKKEAKIHEICENAKTGITRRVESELKEMQGNRFFYFPSEDRKISSIRTEGDYPDFYTISQFEIKSCPTPDATFDFFVRDGKLLVSKIEVNSIEYNCEISLVLKNKAGEYINYDSILIPISYRSQYGRDISGYFESDNDYTSDFYKTLYDRMFPNWQYGLSFIVPSWWNKIIDETFHKGTAYIYYEINGNYRNGSERKCFERDMREYYSAKFLKAIQDYYKKDSIVYWSCGDEDLSSPNDLTYFSPKKNQVISEPKIIAGREHGIYLVNPDDLTYAFIIKDSAGIVQRFRTEYYNTFQDGTYGIERYAVQREREFLLCKTENYQDVVLTNGRTERIRVYETQFIKSGNPFYHFYESPDDLAKPDSRICIDITTDF